MIRSRSVREHGERIAALIRRNVDAMMADRISFATFTRRQRWLWDKAQGGKPLCAGDNSIRARLSEAVSRAL